MTKGVKIQIFQSVKNFSRDGSASQWRHDKIASGTI